MGSRVIGCLILCENALQINTLFIFLWVFLNVTPQTAGAILQLP